MNDEFNYSCRRRSIGQSCAAKSPANGLAPLGAGSGGGPPAEAKDGNREDYVKGWYDMGGAICAMWAFGRSGVHPRIHLLSAENPFVLPGKDPTGLINAHATKGIRLTVGPPEQPDTENSEIKGIEVQVGDAEYVSLMRGMNPDDSDQKITLEDTGVYVKGGDGVVDLTSHKQILISAGGVSSISVTPSGIVMKGPIIRIN
ncbi:MAG: hypothetical protein ABSF22_06340 [Bryobacteraceae bacterium]|jgi:hypothetical protein